jgi:REP element-mobilizing transposase RayT
MPKPRAQLVSLEATPYYHCISRCVRRAFLCGNDSLTGKSFDHRKQWIVDRLKQLTDIFAVDICSYGLMSNHFHVILHIDRERARAWSEEQVAARYERLFRATVEQARQFPEAARAAKVKRWRKRLWSLSWFMRCLNESIARRANAEDNCTGRFWEGRFRSQALLDEGALLTCMAYVDLNPIRAGTATTLEGSEYTSIRERLVAAARGHSRAAGLVPFADQAADGGGGLEPLPVAFADYVEVVRWTAASLGEPKAEEIPEKIGALLGELKLDSVGFVDSIRNFARRFFTMVGQVQKIEVESRRRGYRRRVGIPGARRLYRATAA